MWIVGGPLGEVARRGGQMRWPRSPLGRPGPRCKRSQPVSRVLSKATIPLGPASPQASSSLPGRRAGRASAIFIAALPYLALLRTGFAMPRAVARRAVRSYRTISPLPAPCGASAVCFLLHFPSARAAEKLSRVLPGGARTFLHALRRSGCSANSGAEFSPNRPPPPRVRPGARRSHTAPCAAAR